MIPAPDDIFSQYSNGQYDDKSAVDDVEAGPGLSYECYDIKSADNNDI